MTEEWVLASWELTAFVVASTVAIYAGVIVLTRINGLRSFAKMSAFDFAMTVAVGTLIGSAATLPNPPLVQIVAAIGALFAAQWVIALVRSRWASVRGAVDNRPLLLMRDGEVLYPNLRAARIAETDLWTQLRIAGVTAVDEVVAVVLETTG
ncbi:MAG: YetF domain-containing protein, partial [Dehalococcoidia bacterium]